MKSRTPNVARKLDAPTAAEARSSNPAASQETRAQNWDLHLGFLMHDVSRLRRSVFDEYMRPLGVTRSQWWVLAHLSRHDGMTQSDLADMLDLGKAALGGLVDRLETAKFIERRSIESDRRVKRVYLSGKGKEMLKEMSARGHEMSERILAGLSQSNRHQLAEWLELVKSNLLRIRSDLAINERPSEDD